MVWYGFEMDGDLAVDGASERLGGIEVGRGVFF